ncbi:MAG: 5'/3'-nucleotidase SurE [Spirochaetaceae bacterium]|nr:5'/3'-nucleotidase SurE [Spirochaetaceae bacterium]
MKILISNDDGIHAEGIKVLAAELRKEHEVWVFAPDQERSGVSHAMSLRAPGKVSKHAEREYSCSGTPADCVILAGLGAIPFEPDLVVSGINRGPNLGTDIIYSGTCAAARQAVLHGLPAIAVSCAAYREPLAYGAAASFVRRNLARLVEHCGPGLFINVNAPSSEAEDLSGQWAVPCRRRYLDRLHAFEAPDGHTYCFLSDTRIETNEDESSDHAVVAAGRVAVTPVLVHPQTPSGFVPGGVFR